MVNYKYSVVYLQKSFLFLTASATATNPEGERGGERERYRMSEKNTFRCDECAKSYKKKQHLKRHVISAHSTTTFNCTKCAATFKNPDVLRQHLRTHDDPKYKCDICDKTFALKWHMQSHRKTCKKYMYRSAAFGNNTPIKDDLSSPQMPETKTPPTERLDKSQATKRKIVDENQTPEKKTKSAKSSSMGEDDVQVLDGLQSDVAECYRENWSAIKNRITQNKLRDYYNIRLTTVDTAELRESIGTIFDNQDTAFKINFSYGFIMRNSETNELRYFHSSYNNHCFLEEPIVVRNRDDLARVFEALQSSDIVETLRQKRPSSHFTVETVTNVSFYVFKMKGHPIGEASFLPSFVKHCRGLFPLTCGPHGTYTDKLCFFRCLSLCNGYGENQLERPAKTYFKQYLKHFNKADELFAGVGMDELPELQKLFEVNIYVYELEENDDGTFAQLLHRPHTKFAKTLYMNLYEGHFSFINDMKKYTKSFSCSCCGMFWKNQGLLNRHMKTCTGCIKYKYPGGAYITPKTVFQKLNEHGIFIPKHDRFFPFMATFDLEVYFKKVALHQGPKLEWENEHEIASVSVDSNVEGFKGARCFVSTGHPMQVVEDMLNYMNDISDTSYLILKEKFSWVFELLNERIDADMAREDEALASTAFCEDDDNENDEDDRETQRRLHHYLGRLKLEFDRHLKQLPVIGFNSGRYDINVIKTKLFPLLVKSHKLGFIVKRNNNYMCLTTDKLKLLDILNYLAPGCDYSTFLKAYGIEETKGFFPYEYLTDLSKLEDTSLPPHSAFYSSLKGANISIEEYALCQEAWNDNKMQSLRDYLIFYNDKDTRPMLEAIDKMSAFYRNMNVDLFKDAISVPGLTLKLLFNTMKEGYFTLFDEANKDLYHTFKENIVGGPSIVFSRYHEKDKTYIRKQEMESKGLEPKPCARIVGYDANALYLDSICQQMPTGYFIRRRKDKGFVREYSHRHGRMATQWLDYRAQQDGIHIRHQFNNTEFRVGERRIPVDGFCAEQQKVFQFHGCFYHGHDCRLTTDKDGKRKEYNEKLKMSMEDLLQRTADIRDYIQHLGYEYEEIWECQYRHEIKTNPVLKSFVEKHMLPTEHNYELSEKAIFSAIMSDRMFGVAEVDISVPEHLKTHFAEMPPIFKNTDISIDDIGEHMKRFAVENGILNRPRRSLVGSYFGKKILLGTPLLKWYINHGLEVTQLYQVAEFKPATCFKEFGDMVSDARRAGDRDPNQSIVADTMKLIGNSAYGKTATNKERHRDVRFCGEAKAARSANSPFFRHLTPIDPEVYEVEMKKKKITFDLPIQIAYFVYQYAKLRMLEFYYDCVDRFVDRADFEYCEMDTDSAYMAISGDDLESIIKPSMKTSFENEKHKWFPRTDTKENAAYDKRRPGLFKLEKSGDFMICLCSKTYIIGGEDGKLKISCKGVNKRNNVINKELYMNVLQGRKNASGVNKGFRLHQEKMHTYLQKKDAFSYFYPKRKVLEDGVSTAPLDI